MPERTGRVSGECLDPEVLSAYIDGQLDPFTRSEVEAHLASCADCYDVMSEVLHIQEALPAARPESSSTPPAWGSDAARDVISAPVPRPDGDHVVRGVFGRRKAVWGVASGLLVAAAALVLVVRLQPTWWTGGVDPKLADLVEAVGEERTVEARLTGGFKYGPLRSPVRSGGRVGPTDNWTLLAAAGRIREEAEEDPTPENLHALGVAFLVVGDAEGSLRTLEGLVAHSQGSAAILSDLAAAYLAIADSPGQADAPVKALAAAEKATRLDTSLQTAWFNRACAIEALGPIHGAQQAWRDYLALDTDSPWANEARERLERLRPDDGGARRFQEDADRFLREPPTDAAAQALVEANSQAARELLEDAIWPEYKGLDSPSLEWRDRSDALAAALSSRAHDALPLRVAHSLHSTIDPASRQALVSGFAKWREGRSLYAQNRMAEMTAAFSDAARHLAIAGSPMELWALHYRVVGLYFAGQLSEAHTLGEWLLDEAARHSYGALAARLQWDLGTLLYQQARFEEALTRYRLAAEGFDRAGEFENTTAMNQLIGEALGRLGDSPGSWAHHRAALAGFERMRDPRRRHTLLAAAGHSAINLGFPDAAPPFFSAAIPNAVRWGNAFPVVEAYLNSARSLAAGGPSDAALTFLGQATEWIPRIADKGLRDRTAADLLLAEAEIRLDSDPEAGLHAANRALERYQGAASEYRLGALHLLRGRLYAHLGRTEDARRAWLDGIAALESQRAIVQQRDLRISFFESVWDLYDEMVASSAAAGQADEALRWAERGRARTLLEGVRTAAPVPVDPKHVAALIDADAAIVYLHSTRSALLVWVLRRDSAQLHTVPLDRPALLQLVAGHLSAVRRRESSRASLAELFDVLIRPLNIADARRLVVVPHGPTGLIPFAALFDSRTQRHLIQDHSVSIAPSASILQSMLARTAGIVDPPRSVSVLAPSAALARPDLPVLAQTRAEAEDIAASYEISDVARDQAADAAALTAALTRSDVVHFAGHAIPDAAFPWQARLVLGNANGSDDLFLLRAIPTAVRVRTVVLAACRTASGGLRWGEGMTSLVTPFLEAGASSVVATLWDVDDKLTSQLSRTLHAALAKGAWPGDALRIAQVTAIEQAGPSAHIADWAALTVYSAR